MCLRKRIIRSAAVGERECVPILYTSGGASPSTEAVRLWSRSGTYDQRSETAYLVATLIILYILAKTPTQELAEKLLSCINSAIHPFRGRKGGEKEVKRERERDFLGWEFEVSVLGILCRKSLTSATNHGDPLFLT